MAKFYSLAFVSLLLLALGSCQSLEQISIDYMQPGDMTFPSQLRKVAIVNNTSTEPDNKLITQTEKPKENVPEISTPQRMPMVMLRLQLNRWRKK